MCIRSYAAAEWPDFFHASTGKRRRLIARVNMDAQLIGIDLAQLLPKHKARAEKQRPVPANVAKSAAKSATIGEETRTESR
jgi:hypothetical protein